MAKGYAPKVLVCCDCGEEFVVTADAQVISQDAASPGTRGAARPASMPPNDASASRR